MNKLFSVNCIFTILFVCINLYNPIFGVSAISNNTQTKFIQTIYPVRFVYVNQKGEIEKIWNNVKDTDSKYIVKFFQTGTFIEIQQNESLINQYKNLIIKVNAFIQGDIFNLDIVQNIQLYNARVDFINSTSGLNEIYTYIQ